MSDNDFQRILTFSKAKTTIKAEDISNRGQD